MESTASDQEKPSGNGPFARIKEFFCQYKSEIGAGLLILYVFLLGLGTIGEIWEVEWILDLPIFRPPGKY